MFETAYLERDTIIHRLDPRLKIMIAFLFSVVVATSSRWIALVVALAVVLTWVGVAQLPIWDVLGRLMVLNLFLVFLWLMLAFSTAGELVGKIGPISVSKEGIAYGGLICLRSNIIVLCLMALVGTTSIFTLGRAMGRLGIPKKFVHLLLFTYRYIHVIEVEFRRLVTALKVRGFQPKTNLHTYKTYANLIGMLLVKSYDRSERVKRAMLARGFQGQYHDLWTFSLTRLDMVVGIIMLSQVMFIIVLQWTRIVF